MIYFGIDPGLDGCISAIYGEDRNYLDKIMMPQTDKGSVEGAGVVAFIENTIVKNGFDEFKIMIEDIHAIFGAAAGSTFTMGYGLGIIHGALQTAGFEFSEVQPKAWQKVIWLPEDLTLKKSKSGKTMVNDTKATSIKSAQRLFPEADLRRPKLNVKYYKDNANNRKLGRVGVEVPSAATEPHDGVADSILIAEYCRRLYRE